MTTSIVAVRRKYYFFAIMAKHGKRIKTFITAYLLQAAAIEVYNVHVERKAAFVFIITTENNMLSGRCKIRCPVCLPKICYLFSIGSICISNKHLHLCWCNYALC